MNIFSRFAKDTSGATAIEYGLIAFGIALAIVAVVQSVGVEVKGKYVSVEKALP